MCRWIQKQVLNTNDDRLFHLREECKVLLYPNDACLGIDSFESKITPFHFLDFKIMKLQILIYKIKYNQNFDQARFRPREKSRTWNTWSVWFGFFFTFQYSTIYIVVIFIRKNPKKPMSKTSCGNSNFNVEIGQKIYFKIARRENTSSFANKKPVSIKHWYFSLEMGIYFSPNVRHHR